MQLFYCKDITPGGFCTLDAEESRHAVRVLRLREGDEIHVTDGRGNLYTCRIVDANDKTCVINCGDAAGRVSTDEVGNECRSCRAPRASGPKARARIIKFV